MKIEYMSLVTGELAEGIFDIIKIAWNDFRLCHFFNLKWKRVKCHRVIVGLCE